MKKLLLTLACVASLGLWMSCSDGEELDVTVHDEIERVTYQYGGKATATRYVYKPVELSSMPASGKGYSIMDGGSTKYFHNVWVADTTPVTDNFARLSWTTDISGGTQTNMTTYTFNFNFGRSQNETIYRMGNTYLTRDGTAITLTAGSLDGITFTIKELPNTNQYLPDEDDSYYYDNYSESNPQYVYYGNITYTRGQ